MECVVLVLLVFLLNVLLLENDWMRAALGMLEIGFWILWSTSESVMGADWASGGLMRQKRTGVALADPEHGHSSVSCSDGENSETQIELETQYVLETDPSDSFHLSLPP
jgi:hypothetical protein